jgi:antitoxin HicB
MMRYAVTLTPDDNGTLLATAPDFPEAITFGEDRQDALARAVDAIESAIIGRIEAREDIPRPTSRASDSVALPALSAAKVELYRAMRVDSVGKAELARRLGVALPHVDRLLDLRRKSRLDSLVDAFAALGRTLDIVVKKAA